MLVEREVFSLDDRVCKYLPSYTSHGKDRTTIRHVMTHSAGVPFATGPKPDLKRTDDSEYARAMLGNLRPIYRPGLVHVYHALTWGPLVREIVSAATGKNIRDVLADEILDPLGFRWTNYGVAPEDVEQVGLSYATGPRLLPPLSLLVERVLSAPLAEVVELTNDPRFLTSVMPAASVVTTAEELSRFFEIFRCGGELDGVRVMRPETLRRALRTQARLELDLSLGLPARFSYGLMLGAKLLSLYGRDTDLAFGHLGLINIMGWADPERGISGGLITSGKALVYPEVYRFYGLLQRIASEVPKVPAAQRPF
jgi:CubicO group peptidase (beta-lactamase class C family)